QEPIYAYLYDPLGNNVFIGANSDTDVALFTLTRSGAYTLLLKGSGETIGSFQFRLLDLASAPQITYGLAVTNILDPQIQTGLYRINGQAGQRITITNIIASSGNANWSLIGPNDSVLIGPVGVLNNLGSITLFTPGTYAVVV